MLPDSTYPIQLQGFNNLHPQIANTLSGEESGLGHAKNETMMLPNDPSILPLLREGAISPRDLADEEHFVSIHAWKEV